MHQHPRPPPRTASPASSPKTNPTWTNNAREDEGVSTSRKRSSNIFGYSGNDPGSREGSVSPSNSPTKDSIRKLDQIIQNFHTKAAILVLASRIPLPVIITQEGTKKVNKWFQIETDDTNLFRQELGVWKQCGGLTNRPPPLIIETYIDASELSSNQRLVIFDESGKRWDVFEALSSFYNGDTRQSRCAYEVILERWKFELKDPLCDSANEFGSLLPTVYKKLIVLFRSLYTTTKFVPAGRLVKMLAKTGPTGGHLKINCRILKSRSSGSPLDGLTYPIYENGNVPVTTDYVLGTTDTPVGQIYAEVSYRNDCNFRTDDSESLLSSRFMGADEQIFQPSLGIKGARGQSVTQSTEGESLPRSRPLQTSRNSLISLDGITMARRPSVSFQPFKAGSLSSSPGQTKLTHRGEIIPSPSPQSLPRTPSSNSSLQTRNRSSLSAGTPATLRGVPVPPENPSHFPKSCSPKPSSVSKYSSSFNRRRAQFTGVSGKNTVDEDQVSSGKHSVSSSIQHGSGTLAEAGAGGSSESLQTDDDNISEFLKVLDRQKTLKSFETSSEAATKRTSAQLSRFQSLRESHNALTESMTSSALLCRSTSSSRQITGFPPVNAVTSMSTSSSPSKPVSPHTPHTPTIPSRLSANSIAEHTEPQRPSNRSRAMSGTPVEEVIAEQGRPTTNAIDIPSSPRTYYPHVRRYSLLVQNRSLAHEESRDMSYINNRSVSLGAGHNNDAPSLSTLLKPDPSGKNISPSSGLGAFRRESCISGLTTEIPLQAYSSTEANTLEHHQDTQSEASDSKDQYCSSLGQLSSRYSIAPTHTVSEPSFTAQNNDFRTNERVGSRCSMARCLALYDLDDEPLLFQMSEIGRDNSRTSVDDARDPHTGERDLYENPRGSKTTTSKKIEDQRNW